VVEYSSSFAEGAEEVVEVIPHRAPEVEVVAVVVGILLF
jgi:hypothetical protein